jgi:hypothetical protein
LERFSRSQDGNIKALLKDETGVAGFFHEFRFVVKDGTTSSQLDVGRSTAFNRLVDEGGDRAKSEG